MSIRSRIIINNLTAILVLNAISMTVGFVLFMLFAEPFAGARLRENALFIAARYFPTGGVVVLILTGIGAVWLIGVTARRVTGPLAKLKRSAAEIRDGNLGFELAISGHDEFSELAAGFEQMRIRLKDTMRLQEKSETERRAMMASVTHDLKTPITSILGYAEGILDGVAGSPERIKEYAAVICKKARSLQVLSEDLSLLSRLENAQLPLDRTPTDLGELVSEVALEFSSGDVEMNLDMNLAPGLTVSIDREKTARVLVNILQNSVKYKKPEQSRANVSVTLSKHNGDALLTISDDGTGISQSDLPYVFDQFYRADASRGRQSGSGLGLSIARHLISLHGGKTWIVNNAGGGISVNITLPLHR